MQTPPIPDNEPLRLEALLRYDVLDTDAEPAFDRLTELAQALLGVPTVLISLVDCGRQWFKSRIGLEATETSRDISFCGHAVYQGAPLVVPDATQDPRFADNPLVTGPLGLRYYVGAPLVTADGFVLGTLCAIDYQAREAPSAAQLELLTKLADTVVSTLELRRLASHHKRQSEVAALMRQVASIANQAASVKEAVTPMLHELCLRLRFAMGIAHLGTHDSLFEPVGAYYQSPDLEVCPAVQMLYQQATQHSFMQGTYWWSQAMLDDRVVHVGELASSHDARSQLARAAGLNHALYIAIKADKQTIGFLEVYGSSPSGTSDDLCAIGEAISHTLNRLAVRERMATIKRDFISTVNHELRTPLTSIAAALELLQAGKGGELPPKAAQMVGIAERNSVRLKTLVNDILDVGKIDAGGLTLEMGVHAVAPLIEQAITELAPMAAPMGVAINMSSLDPDLTAMVDPLRFVQVMTNLLSNAAKFSPRGEAVLVHLARRGNSMRISVSDKGPGIPESFKSRVFERFAQAGGADHRQHAGSGLGLSIAQGLVTRFGGHVSFDSSPNTGTTFHVDLPVCDQHATSA